MDRSEPVARCAWCVELNPLSANYCQHCGHEAHTTRAACHCLACRAGVEVCIDCGFSRLVHDELDTDHMFRTHAGVPLDMLARACGPVVHPAVIRRVA